MHPYRRLFFAALFLGMIVAICPAQTKDNPTPEDLATLWRNTDAIVLLKIRSRLPDRIRMQDPCPRWEESDAKIIETFRRYFGAMPETIHLTRPSCGPEAGDMPMNAGKEFVAFLSWQDQEKAYRPTILVPVVNKRVQSPFIRELQAGTALEAFLIKLRSMME
jgi:hypothetical protein